ncbi:MAG TPA: SMP-30/gluconolactonase/LRE family protein [Methylomirabilota bacterium]|nr:SMP-30/gluconolactonase/LRE family protein [Methylomirabilota bacterium]
MHKILFLAIISCGCALPLRSQNLSGDEALSKVLIEGEGWQDVASGFGMTDAACNDAEGNFYFSDLSKSVVHRITPVGKASVFLNGGPKISGLKFGPDGRLYACTQGPKKQVIAIALPSKEITILADDVQPNDLVVSPKGFVYFTETPKGQVTGIDVKTGKVFPGATKLNAPNGIALSLDGGTLAVSEYRGSNVWTFRVHADGTLDAGAPYMTLRTPTGKAESAGDGMTVDSMGRYYVTSALGIQMFDWTGRMGGVIARPQNKGTFSCGFGGEGLHYLYACSSDKVYRRKLQTPGIWLFRQR